MAWLHRFVLILYIIEHVARVRRGRQGGWAGAAEATRKGWRGSGGVSQDIAYLRVVHSLLMVQYPLGERLCSTCHQGRQLQAIHPQRLFPRAQPLGRGIASSASSVSLCGDPCDSLHRSIGVSKHSAHGLTLAHSPLCHLAAFKPLYKIFGVFARPVSMHPKVVDLPFQFNLLRVLPSSPEYGTPASYIHQRCKVSISADIITKVGPHL